MYGNAFKRLRRPFAAALHILLTLFALPMCVVPTLSQASPQELQSQASDPDLQGLEADIAADRLQQVEPLLGSYLRNHPNSSRAHYDLGYIQFRNHEIGPSIRQLTRSLELDPKNAEAHKVLALDCSIIGRYDIAETELQEAVRLKPDSAEIHYFLARMYYTKGVYPLAKTEFETTIRLDSSYGKAYSNLGITMEALGDDTAALKDYLAAVHREDLQKNKSEWPYIYLCSFYNRRKDAANAIPYAQKATEINPTSDTAYFELAKAFRTQNEFQRAVQAVRRAIGINSQVPQYYYVMGLMLRELGELKESEQALATYAHLLQNAGTAAEHQSEEPLTSEPR